MFHSPRHSATAYFDLKPGYGYAINWSPVLILQPKASQVFKDLAGESEGALLHTVRGDGYVSMTLQEAELALQVLVDKEPLLSPSRRQLMETLRHIVLR